MAISSLVVGVADDAAGLAALAAIRADARFTVGPGQGNRHALVLDTPSAKDDTVAFDWLRDLPGVRSTTVVRIHLDDDQAVPAGVAATFL